MTPDSSLSSTLWKYDAVHAGSHLNLHILYITPGSGESTFNLASARALIGEINRGFCLVRLCVHVKVYSAEKKARTPSILH